MPPALRTGHCRHLKRLTGGFALLLLSPSSLWPQTSQSAPRCGSVTLTITLKAGEAFQRRINGLTFRLKPMEENWGWIFTLENGAGRDFVYPVNPPLRFNGSQILGRGYGDSTRDSLKRDRELRFLLNQADYERFEPILNHALWPYYAPKPDRATEEYFTALSKIRTGMLRVKILKSDVASDDAVRSAKFQVEFIAPVDFQFEPLLTPRPIACPSTPKQ